MTRGIITNATDWRSRKLQGYITFQGLPISIENERGSYRQGIEEATGHVWRTFMHIAYGYIRLTEGTDGDHVDVYVGPNSHSEKVFVVHQQIPETKRFDEDKVMLGFNSAAEAKAAYLRQYDKPGFFQSMSTYDMATFKRMLKDRKGMKLKKSLTPRRQLVTRGGKTFMTTVYVGSTRAEEKERAKKKAVTSEVIKNRNIPESTIKIMKDQRRVIDYAPNDKLAVDKILAFQKAIFKGKEKPSLYDIINIATEEVEYALKREESGKDWYREAMDETRSILITHYPDLAGDVEWDFFLSILAITSPTQAPTPNLRNAVIVYDHYRKTGEIPVKDPRTKEAFSIAGTALLKRFKKRLSMFPNVDSFVQFMNGVSTVGDLNAGYGSKISGKKDEAAFNAMIFGEKVGMFYQSMRGTEGAVAVDRWAIRSYYRWTGTLTEGLQTGEVGKGRVRVINDRMSVGERKNVEYVMQTVADRLGLIPSEVQAVMWFYEKRLYEKLGMGRGAIATDNFVDASKKVFMEKAQSDLLSLSAVLKTLSSSGRLPTFDKFMEAIMAITERIEKAKKMAPGSITTHRDGSRWKKIGGGKWERVTGKRASTGDPLRELVSRARESIFKYTGNKYERALAFDSDGNQILAKSGKDTSVVFTADEAFRLRGATVIHNHPSFPGEPPITLSPADIVMAIMSGLESIVAVTKSTTFRYSGFENLRENLYHKFVNDAKKIYSDTPENADRIEVSVRIMIADHIMDAFQGECLDGVRKLMKQLSTGNDKEDEKKFNSPEIQARAQDIRMQEFARKYGGKYEKW